MGRLLLLESCFLGALPSKSPLRFHSISLEGASVYAASYIDETLEESASRSDLLPRYLSIFYQNLAALASLLSSLPPLASACGRPLLTATHYRCTFDGEKCWRGRQQNSLRLL